MLGAGGDEIEERVEAPALEVLERLVAGGFGHGRVAELGEERLGVRTGGDPGPHDQVAGVAVAMPAQRTPSDRTVLALEQTGVLAVLVLTAAQPCAVPLELCRGRVLGELHEPRGRSPGAPHGSAHAPSSTTTPPQRTRRGSRAAHATGGRHGPARAPRPSRHRTASSTSAHTTTPATTPTPTGVVLTDHHQERTRRRRQMRRQRPHLLLQTLQRHRVDRLRSAEQHRHTGIIAIGHRGSPSQVQAAALTLRTGCDTDR